MKACYFTCLFIFMFLILSCSKVNDQKISPNIYAEKLSDRDYGGSKYCSAEASDHVDIVFSPEETQRTIWDATVKIIMNDESICSGVILGPSKIVTAAHCFDGFKKIKRLVREYGGYQEEELKVLRVKIDEQFSKMQRSNDHPLDSAPQLSDNDIAFIEFASEETRFSEFKEFIQTTNSIPAHSDVIIVGYGVEKAFEESVKKLSSSKLHLVCSDQQPCIKNFKNTLVLDNPKERGACPGDSGAGVFVKINGVYKIIGIVSGMNNVLYPGLDFDQCSFCPRGLGIIRRLSSSDLK